MTVQEKMDMVQMYRYPLHSVRPEPFALAQGKLRRGAPKSKDAQDRLVEGWLPIP
jgi:hypothetical protein